MKARTMTRTLALAAAVAAIGWGIGEVKVRQAGFRPPPAGAAAARASQRSGGAAFAASQSSNGGQLVVTTKAKRQDLLLTVTQTGAVVARNAAPVIPEISGRIQWVCPNGIVVPAGGVVMRLDPTTFQEQVTDLTVRYQEAVRRQAQADAVGKARMQELRLRLKRAQDGVSAFERQQEAAAEQSADAISFDAGELQHRREDAEVTRRLASRGLVPGTQVERQDAAVKADEFDLRSAQSDHELTKSQAASDAADRWHNVNDTMRDMTRTRSRSERGVRMTGNEVDNLKLQLERAREDLARTTLTAPMGGLVVQSATGGGRSDPHLPALGDWVSQGRQVADMVSLDRMQVKLELDQAQITGVRMGQPAEVIIEALLGKVLPGKVTAIGQTARRPPIQGWMGMSSSVTFPVTVDLPPTGKSLIRPGMRATVRMVSRRIKGAIVVPSGCIFQRDGRSVVLVQRGGKFTPAAVTLGESNGDYTAITRGLRAGERIALNDLAAPPPAAGGQKRAPTPEQARR